MTSAHSQKIDRPPPGLWHELWRLTALAVPIVVSLAGATLIIVIDTIMIAPLGTVPLAAASITATVFMVCSSALYGFISLIGVRMAEAFGTGDPAALRRVTQIGLTVSLTTGVTISGAMLAFRSALPALGQPAEVIAELNAYWQTMALALVPFTLFYTLKGLFDAIEAPWIGVALAFLAVLVNIPANWVLIHGLGAWQGFGLLGAGLASLLSLGLSLVAAFGVWRRHPALAEAHRTKPASNTREARIQLREGGAISLGYLGESGAYAIASLMMGWFGAAALAAQRIVSSVGEVLYMIPFGVAVAVSIRVGQAIGAGHSARVATMGYAALVLIIAWTLCMMGLVLIGAGPVARALSEDSAVISLGISLFLITAAMQVADGVQGTMLGAARGMSDNRVPVAITLLSYWLLGLPLAYMLGFWTSLGPIGIWIGYAAGLLVAGTCITRRFFKKARAFGLDRP